MIHTRFVLFGLLVLSTLPLCAGTVVTRDGATFRGDVFIENARVVVRSRDGQKTYVNLDQLAEAVFAPMSPADFEKSDPPPREKEEQGTGNVLAEYFADSDLKDRRLARYEQTINGYWSHKEIPEPAIPGRCFVRYSASLVSKKSASVTVAIEVHGGARLYVKNKLEIDRWTTKAYIADRVQIQMTAGVPVPIRLETRSGEYEHYVRMAWRGAGFDNYYIPADAFVRPADRPNQPPTATLTAPEFGTRLISPPSVMLQAQASDPDGKVAAVDFLDGHMLVGTAKAPPFQFIWKDPPVGYHRIRAKAIDEKGLASYSPAGELCIAGKGLEGTLPPPWGEQTIQQPRSGVGRGTVSYSNGIFRLTRAGGLITEEQHDGAHFVYQPVKGDFTLVAKLRSVKPDDTQVGAIAGIMARDSMAFHAKTAAILAGSQGTVFLRRTENWAKPAMNDQKQTAPCWLKLVRYGSRLRAYCSADGKIWTFMGSDKLNLGQTPQVGLCAMSRSEDAPCEAIFEQVSLTQGSPEMAITAPGLLLRDGTFLACHVYATKDNMILYNRNGKEKLSLRSSEVARAVYQPMLAELVEQLPPGQSGVLLGNGDFVEGEVKEVSYRVTLSSVLFGNRYFSVKDAGVHTEVVAICFRAVQPAKGYVFAARDGSIYRLPEMPRVVDQVFKFEVPALGAVELPVGDLMKMRVE